MFERMFQLKAAGTTVKTEILAGLTTFMTMGYIIFVNPSIMADAGMPFGPVMVATCIASALATALMAFLANYPVGLSTGMGLNAFFAYSVVLGMGIDWRIALAAIFVEGVLFVLLTLTNLREKVVNGFPNCLKIGISAGIGLFIAFVGLQGAGIIVKNDSTLVAIGNLTSRTSLLAIIGFIIIAGLECHKVRGSILWGIIATTIIAVFWGVSPMPDQVVSLPPSIAPLFFKLDFSMLGSWQFWGIVFAFFFVDFFDTVGTLIGVSHRSGMLDAQGRLPRAKQALMADAVGTVAGACLGTSTITSFVESASGVEQGGRTGLTALTVSVLFLLAIFFSPLVGIVPSAATAPGLVMVGVYMMMSLGQLDFKDLSEVIPTTITLMAMPFAYSIGTGIELGVLCYTFVKLVAGRAKEISLVMWLLTLVFILKEAAPYLSSLL